jgi:hypothetical protein
MGAVSPILRRLKISNKIIDMYDTIYVPERIWESACGEKYNALALKDSKKGSALALADRVRVQSTLRQSMPIFILLKIAPNKSNSFKWQSQKAQKSNKFAKKS